MNTSDVQLSVEESRGQALRPYPKYKDSTVEWLGEIPSHWAVDRVKYLATLNDEVLAESTDPGLEITYVDIGSVDTVSGITQTESVVFQDAPSRARRVVRNGDVIISTVRTYLRAITTIRVERQNLIVSTGFAVLRPHRLDSAFASYALRAPYFVERVVANSVGVSYPAINATTLTCFSIAYPCVEEQRAIAAYLDYETTKIDALVERKERLIELLHEKRAALITHAVTRGLDPNVPMKDSDVEWLGEIPLHWDVKRVKWVARMESGHTPDKKVEGYWDGDVPWVSLNDTQHLRDHDFIADTAYYTNERGLENSSARLLPPRSVIFSRDATIGLCAITERAMAVSQHFIAWLCGNDISPGYLLRVFDAMQDELHRLTAGATLRTIGMPDVRTLTTPVPPVDEQQTIVQHIQQKCVAVDQATAKIRHAVALLKESRTALVSAAVTGKIDVRNEAS